MKRNRIIWSILWGLSLVGISFYGGWISYGIFCLLTLVPIISLLYIFCVFLLFKVYQNMEGRQIICGHPSVFYFTIQNESPMFFSGIRLVFYSSFSTINGLDDQTEYEFRPYAGIRKRTDIVCRYRGEYEVGIKYIVIQDFFRLFSISYRNREPFKVFVKPDTVFLTELQCADVAFAAVRDARLHQDEPDLRMREYVAGDDPRLINWKASGAAGKLMLRERIGQRQQGIGILMDPHRYSDRKEQYLPVENKLLEAVIALNLFLIGQGIAVETFTLGAGLVSYSADPNGGFEAFYERMAAYAFSEEKAEMLYEAVLREGRIREKAAVFMIVHEWDTAAVGRGSELS